MIVGTHNTPTTTPIGAALRTPKTLTTASTVRSENHATARRWIGTP